VCLARDGEDNLGITYERLSGGAYQTSCAVGREIATASWSNMEMRVQTSNSRVQLYVGGSLVHTCDVARAISDATAQVRVGVHDSSGVTNVTHLFRQYRLIRTALSPASNGSSEKSLRTRRRAAGVTGNL